MEIYKELKTPASKEFEKLLNSQFSKNKNLVELKERLKKIDLIDNIYVQEFNNEYIFLKIKYLGKIDKIIQLLKKEKIILQLTEDQWRLKII